MTNNFEPNNSQPEILFTGILPINASEQTGDTAYQASREYRLPGVELRRDCFFTEAARAVKFSILEIPGVKGVHIGSDSVVVTIDLQRTWDHGQISIHNRVMSILCNIFESVYGMSCTGVNMGVRTFVSVQDGQRIGIVSIERPRNPDDWEIGTLAREYYITAAAGDDFAEADLLEGIKAINKFSGVKNVCIHEQPAACSLRLTVSIDTNASWELVEKFVAATLQDEILHDLCEMTPIGVRPFDPAVDDPNCI